MKKTAKSKAKPMKAKKPAPRKPALKKEPVKAAPKKPLRPLIAKPVRVAPEVMPELPVKEIKVNCNTDWHRKQRKKLVELRDRLLEGIDAVERDHLRKLPSDASGELSHYGTHMADAGSDSYDRDFALSILSQEQDALYEIDEALKRLDESRYGVCEMSGKAIPRARLEAIPFARYSVECQAQLERDQGNRRRWASTTNVFESFGNAESESADDEDEK